MEDTISQWSSTTMILLSLSLILLAGFLFTRITNRIKLPHVTGYIVAGVLIGPYVLNLIPVHIVESMSFVSDIALGFIAFGVGRFFKKEAFQETGIGVLMITLLESLLAGILVTTCLYYMFHLDFNFCLLLGAIATATAPASTMVTIRQYHARGPFVNTLLQVVAFDDAVCLIVFSIATALINMNTGAAVSFMEMIRPIIYNVGALLLGLICGILLSKLITPSRSEDNRLIVTTAFILFLSGVCAAVYVSPLLACMVFSTTYMNLTHDKQLFQQIEKFTPPILCMFFVVSGMSLNIRSFGSLGIIGLAYFGIRIAGKYLGAYLGCMAAKTSATIRNYLGLALIPQAGVAIGLAFLGKRVLPNELGNMLLTIILSSSVLYELIGPVSAKMALLHSGDIRQPHIKEAKSSTDENNHDTQTILKTS